MKAVLRFTSGGAFVEPGFFKDDEVAAVGAADLGDASQNFRLGFQAMAVEFQHTTLLADLHEVDIRLRASGGKLPENRPSPESSERKGSGGLATQNDIGSIRGAISQSSQKNIGLHASRGVCTQRLEFPIRQGYVYVARVPLSVHWYTPYHFTYLICPIPKFFTFFACFL
jgi:hypothetical protein